MRWNMTTLAKKIVSKEDTCDNGILSTNMMMGWLNSSVYTYCQLNLDQVKILKSRMESVELIAPVFLGDVLTFNCKKYSAISADVLIVKVIRNNSIVVESVYKISH